jgi:hypothetical protein
MTNEGFRLLAQRLTGNQAPDLLQDVAVVICEKSPEELEKLNEYFDFWVSRVIMNMASKTGTTGKITNKRKKLIVDYIVEKDVENLEETLSDYNHNIDKRHKQIETLLDEMYWYDRDMFYTYLECGSLRKVEAVTNIPYSSVFSTVNKVKKHIKEKI